MTDSRIVSVQEIESKIAKVRIQINDNRSILEAMTQALGTSSANGIARDSEEYLWIRSVLNNRANLLKETLDRLHDIRTLYRQNRQTEAIERQQKLAGMLLIDGVVKAKINPDASIF